MKGSSSAELFNEASLVAVIKVLGRHSISSSGLDLGTISILTKLGNEKEALRNLYSLEGYKLAVPVPEGDLTSRHWALTELGKRMLNQRSEN